MSDPRTRCNLLRHCERSEAIHIAAQRKMDCFVARAPRNDVERSLPRPDQRDRLIAFVEIQQTPQRFAALALQLRVVLHDPQRLVARLRYELAMDVGARDTVAGQAALPDAEYVAFATQFQVFLGNPEAVGGFPDHFQTRRRHLVERLLVEQQAGRGFRTAADPAAQLMQLREPKALRVLD